MRLTALFFARSPANSIGVNTARSLSEGLFLPPLATIRHLTASASFCIAFFLLTPPAFAQAVSHSSSTGGADLPDIIFVQAKSVESGKLSQRFPAGSRIVRFEKGTRRLANLTQDFFCAADPRISFDGSKVLFAAKKDAAGAWQIWEMNTDGTEQHQVTHCPKDCLSPAYLPRDAIAFSGEVSDGDGTGTYQLFVAKLDGSDVQQITFGPGDYQLETVLQNGLILASARSPLEMPRESKHSRNLYTMRPDGTALVAFRSDREDPAIRSQAEELDDGSVVFVKNTKLDSEVGGNLAAIERGATHNSIIGPASASIWSPRKLEASRLIVARRVTSPAAAAQFDLYSFDFIHGKFQAPIYHDSELSSIEAVPIAAHAAPRWYWSTLRADIKVGYFICLDASLSDEGPKGRPAQFPSTVRVLGLDPSTAKEASLGEAPVERDGSFYIAVPPDRPVRFELLSSGGKVVRGQKSWTWARQGEEHGCVGCHEDRAVAPENRWPLALRRSDAPFCLGVQPPLEAAH